MKGRHSKWFPAQTQITLIPCPCRRLCHQAVWRRALPLPYVHPAPLKRHLVLCMLLAGGLPYTMELNRRLGHNKPRSGGRDPLVNYKLLFWILSPTWCNLVISGSLLEAAPIVQGTQPEIYSVTCWTHTSQEHTPVMRGSKNYRSASWHARC